jgi:ABC-type nitrate/sulfonate/bicarbonate transport system substrate-binding protein
MVAALLVVVAMACGDDGGDGAAPGGADRTGGGQTEKVTVLLDWTPNTNHSGIYLAQAEGWYAEAGLDVEVIEPDLNAGGTGLAQLAAGNATFAVSNAEALLPARAEGVPVVSVAAIIEHNTSSLVAPADRGISSPADLAGKTYGGFGGPLEEALVKEMIRCAGGDPTSVRTVEVGNVDYRVGFDQKAFDFVWVFDGWDVIRMRDMDGLALSVLSFADYAECIPDWYTPLLASSEKVIAERPEVVRSFLAATARGYREAMADPGAAAASLKGAAPESDAELLDRSATYLAERYAETPGAWGRQDPAVWARFEEWLRRQGILASRVDTAAAFTNDFLAGP